MKRKVFLVLAIFSLMAVGLYAQTEADFTVETSKDGKSVKITTYKGKATAVNIPAKIKNLPVTIIGEYAFYGDDIEFCKSITSVTFQGTITTANFELGAFDGDLRDKYLAANGGIGTYTRPASGTTWTKK